MSPVTLTAMLTAGLLAAGPPLARGRPTTDGTASEVLILEVPPSERSLVPTLEERLAAELRLLGFQVRRHALPPGTSEAPAAALRRHTTLAGAQLGVTLIRVASPPPRIEVWLMDRITGKVSLRRIPVPRDDPQAASLLALRAVELLRASLLELTIQRPSRKAPVLPPPMLRLVQAARPLPEAPARWGVRLGPGIAGSVGGVGPHVSLEVALRWEPLRLLAVELAADAALAGPDVRSSDGEAAARVGFGAVRIWLLWEILRSGRWRPALGLGGGVLGLWTRGDESLEFHARQALAVVGDAALTAQLAMHLHHHLALRLGIVAGLAIPRVSVTFADRRMATFGVPHVAAHLTMEARF